MKNMYEHDNHEPLRYPQIACETALPGWEQARIEYLCYLQEVLIPKKDGKKFPVAARYVSVGQRDEVDEPVEDVQLDCWKTVDLLWPSSTLTSNGDNPYVFANLDPRDPAKGPNLAVHYLGMCRRASAWEIARPATAEALEYMTVEQRRIFLLQAAMNEMIRAIPSSVQGTEAPRGWSVGQLLVLVNDVQTGTLKSIGSKEAGDFVSLEDEETERWVG